jgi:hypothetical protein
MAGEQRFQCGGVGPVLSRLEAERKHLEASLSGLCFNLGIRGTDEPDLEPCLCQPQAQVEGGGDRAGATTLVEHLHDGWRHPLGSP